MNFSTLNDKQQEILKIISSHIRVNGKSPSLRDIMGVSTTIRSMRGVALQLDVLEKAGYISRSSKAKSIEINPALISPRDDLIEIPLFSGVVQAGLPSIFEEYSDETIPIRLSVTKGLTDVYAIRVQGESMLDAEIEEGDYAIITEQVNPRDGDIVIALFNGAITIKRFRNINGHPILFPENKNNDTFKPISSNFEVKGKLVNVLKPQILDYFKKSKSLL